jgi:hypothetical protein
MFEDKSVEGTFMQMLESLMKDSKNVPQRFYQLVEAVMESDKLSHSRKNKLFRRMIDYVICHSNPTSSISEIALKMRNEFFTDQLVNL